ncbi:MAG: hypothetical protein WC781_04935 [Candidatus Pacearchaeota archaeon]
MKSSKNTEIVDAETEEKRNLELLSKVIIFPGSIEEYERFTGYKVEIINTLESDKGMEICNPDTRTMRLIKEEGVEAIVNAYTCPTEHVSYGLPVRRK